MLAVLLACVQGSLKQSPRVTKIVKEIEGSQSELCISKGFMCVSHSVEVWVKATRYKVFLFKVQAVISLKSSVIWDLQGGRIIQHSYYAA